MSVTIYWAADDPTVTAYALARSSDKGLTYSDLGTVPYNTTGPSYDARTKRFFFVDSGGGPGDVYKLTASGSLGVSKPAYIVAPPAAPNLCSVIGYVTDAFGYVDREMRIVVRAYGARGERWHAGGQGIVAQNPEALGVTESSRVVFPDQFGMWNVDLIQGVFAQVSIPALQYEHAFRVPLKDGPINIRDIPRLRGEELRLFSEISGIELPES